LGSGAVRENFTQRSVLPLYVVWLGADAARHLFFISTPGVTGSNIQHFPSFIKRRRSSFNYALVVPHFFLGFAIKVPMFHSTPGCPTSREAPTAGSVILAGVLLEDGNVRFRPISLPFFPQV